MLFLRNVHGFAYDNQRQSNQSSEIAVIISIADVDVLFGKGTDAA